VRWKTAYADPYATQMQPIDGNLIPTPDDAAVRAELSEILFGFMRTQALATAAKLGIADIVNGTARDVGEIARQVGADESSLYRLLRFLASQGVFEEVEPRRFGSTRLSRGLQSSAPLTLRYIAIAMGSEQYDAWSEAAHAFVTGEPGFDQKYGQPYFEYLADNGEASTTFNRAMAAGTNARVAALVALDWSKHTLIADIGGGSGTAIAAVLAAHTHLRGVLFDLPNVVAEAPAVLEQADVGDRCEIVGGSFLSDPLPPADAYVLSQILHDWDDEHSATILRNCRRTIVDDGQLLVLDGVVPPGPEPGFLKHMDLHMLVMLGGKERTEDEWRHLLFGEGFVIAQISSAGPANLIEARPV
jgi:SAM-dependent methyltransferase